MSARANQLADRIVEGAALLAAAAKDFSREQWATIVPRDGRTVGVIVHHVANMYPIEMDVVRQAVAGTAITEVTWELVAEINAAHAREQAQVSKTDAVELLLRNSQAAAAEVRKLTDADLERSVPFSLSFGAPMTVQFIIEDHPLRHAWHHLARIRAALASSATKRGAAAA